MTVEAASAGVNTPAGLHGRRLALWNGLLRLQRGVLLVCGALLTVLVAVQVFTRYVLGVSLFGIEELATFVAVWLYFVGAAHGAWERSHISASLVGLVLREGRARDALDALAGAITVVLSAWMSLWAWQYLAFTLQRGTRSLEVGISLAWVHVIMPVGLSLMTLYFAVEFVERARALGRKG